MPAPERGLVPTLVFLEHHGGELQKGPLGVLRKAATLGDADGVIAGSGVGDLAVRAHGAKKVWVADDPALEAEDEVLGGLTAVERRELLRLLRRAFDSAPPQPLWSAAEED